MQYEFGLCWFFYIIKSLEETINKKNKSFEYLKNGFPLQFFLACISSVMHFNVNNLKGLFVNNKARTA